LTRVEVFDDHLSQDNIALTGVYHSDPGRKPRRIGHDHPSLQLLRVDMITLNCRARQERRHGMNYAVVLSSVFAVHVLAMISPGPNVLIVTQTAISHTRRAGIVTALGVAIGSTIWSSAALFGLSVVFAQFAWLYEGIKLLGGIYLLYLGIKLWRTADHHPLVPSSSHATVHTDRQALRLGLLTNLTNPKAVIFFGSIFAALLTPTLPMWVKLAAIGIIAVDATGWHVALACFFSTRRAQQVYRRIKRWVDRTAGVALAFLGLRLILPSRLTTLS
jgi:threonine efflux protein